jgi:hypothetical protein
LQDFGADDGTQIQVLMERPANMQPQDDQLLLRITYTRAAIQFS